MSDIENKPAYTEEELSQLKRPELNRLAKKVGINNLAGKNDMMITRIIEQVETNTCRWDEDGEIAIVRTVEDNKRRHPVLGEYVKVVITPRDQETKREYFANNDYMCNAPMNEEIIIPEGFIDFINKAAHTVEHYYDENAFNPETGKLGVHTTRRIQDYFCSRV